MIDIPKRYKPTGVTYSGGGMSDAVVCTDTHLDREVVVKSLNEITEQQRLLDEISALTDIRSKHVVQIYDIIKDKDGEIVGLIEEHLTGEEIGTLSPMKDMGRYLEIIHSIASGIADIHAHDRVHRDIKPNNMKLDSEGCLKIFDFGLSRIDDTSAATLGVVGTLGYLAPELCVEDDEIAIFSQPVDVFAFGATALRLLRTTLPADLRFIPPHLPAKEADFHKQAISLEPAIADLLNACLEETPDDRPEMSAVRDVVASILLKNKHRATLVFENKRHVLDSSNPAVNVNSGGSTFQIRYDGLQFLLLNISGNIYVNAIPAVNGQSLPGACVVTVGAPELGNRRRYITIDLSYPEVTI